MKKLLFTCLILLVFNTGYGQIDVSIQSRVLIVSSDNLDVYAQKLNDNYIFSFKITSRDVRKFQPGQIINVQFVNERVILQNGEVIRVNEFHNNTLGAENFSTLYCRNLPSSASTQSAAKMLINPERDNNDQFVPRGTETPVLNKNDIKACCFPNTNEGILFKLSDLTLKDINHTVYVCNNFVFVDAEINNHPKPLIYAVTSRWVDSSRKVNSGSVLEPKGYDQSDNIAARPASENAVTKGIPGGKGRLNLNFPPGVYWSIDIYSGNKFMTNRSIETYKQKHYDLTPGFYNMKLNTVLIENIQIEAGKTTTITAGILEINSNDWELRSSDGKKFLTSGNKPAKLVLPAGSYQLKSGKNEAQLVDVLPSTNRK